MFSSGNSAARQLRHLVVLAGTDPSWSSLLLVGNLERSRVGWAWVAIRRTRTPQVMGVNTFRFKLWAFVIGAAIGGLSGAMRAGQVQVARRRRSTSSTRCCSCAGGPGGQGNKLGVIFGAFVIVYPPNRLLACTSSASTSATRSTCSSAWRWWC